MISTLTGIFKLLDSEKILFLGYDQVGVFLLLLIGNELPNIYGIIS